MGSQQPRVQQWPHHMDTPHAQAQALSQQTHHCPSCADVNRESAPLPPVEPVEALALASG